MYQQTTATTTTTTTTPAYNPYTNHYPTQYSSTSPSIPYFPPFPSIPILPPPTAPELPPVLPNVPIVTPEVASRAMQRLIALQLRNVGFDSGRPDAVKQIELHTVAFIQQLFQRSHEYANLSNRAGPIATDLVLACEEFNIPPKSLRANARKKSKKSKKGHRAPTLQPAASRSPSPDLLPSDDEGTPATIPSTLRTFPTYLPALPPKHTYLRTPASPPKKAAVPSLKKKLKTASLVQESLKNLLLATEDNTNQEDAELLGHIVNWEVGVYPRKRWRTSRKH